MASDRKTNSPKGQAIPVVFPTLFSYSYQSVIRRQVAELSQSPPQTGLPLGIIISPSSSVAQNTPSSGMIFVDKELHYETKRLSPDLTENMQDNHMSPVGDGSCATAQRKP